MTGVRHCEKLGKKNIEVGVKDVVTRNEIDRSLSFRQGFYRR